MNNGLVQNCIAIDTDNTATYLNTGSTWGGGLGVASTDYQADNITFRNSMVVNSKIGGLSVSANNAVNNLLFSNCAIIDTENKADLNVIHAYGTQDVYDHCTFHLADGGYAGINGYGGSTPHTITNSIISDYAADWDGAGDLLTYQITGNYCNFYGCTGTQNGTYTNAHTVDPIWTVSNTTGALKYPVRIETGSNLSGHGLTGDIGANLTYLWGTPGTVWGETGYDTETATSMWPFPSEALIKTKMAAYTATNVTGARGFCTGNQLNGSAKTLTSYIWEYLGNQIPADIYGSEEESPPTIGCNLN